ncbi:hypothetical protein GCM10010255_28490 [Streptomyces coeruleofuscus]|uniref:Uncharacterized protein n=1 Tax=Streptomyces coeruleofuscus TaxID=66879 RepID=A0ABN3I6X1_9ACTN
MKGIFMPFGVRESLLLAGFYRPCRSPWSGSGAVALSSSPKSGAWKGFVAGGGDAVAAEWGAPSGAEKSEVRSMRGLLLVPSPGRDLVCRDRAQRC